MKHIIITTFLVFLPLLVAGQTLSVESFEMDLKDQTANNETTKQIDDNGEVCALIRIETTQKGFSYDGGTVGIVKADESKIGEIWLYVPAGLSHITIRHPQLGTLRDYYFPERLQAARTYVMKLMTGSVTQVVNQKRTSQVFVMTFTPKQAIVEIDGVTVETDDGTYSGVLSFGTHEYRITSKNYHSEVGSVTVGEEKQVKNIDLKPAFGWIEVQGPAGASVYIDGEKVKNAPMKSEPLASGKHEVRVTKEKYLPYHDKEVLVNDNTITPLNPVLKTNFVTVTLNVANNAEIWVDGEKRGSGSVTIDLVPNEYSFETRKASHRSQTIVRQITMASGGSIDLPAPVAILGSIMVNVKPVGAKVTVDGKAVGESPVILDDILIGQHEVVISKQGCADMSKIVTVTEGETTNVEGRLAEGQDVRLSCGVAGARWTVDGVDRGVGAEITLNMSYAEHSVKINADDYNDFGEKFVVSVETASKSFTMRKIVADVETITVNGVSFKMIRVEGGTFQMGSNNGESDEKPIHRVKLSGYYIGEKEVTQALWEKVMGSNPSYRKGDNLPVENVSWNDCQEFIKELNRLTGRTFALPTEAQWEYAARGGDKSRGYTYSGSNTIGNVAWYHENSSSWTHQVGTKQENELGLYDISGNVWEWCSDWYGSYSSTQQMNPAGPSSGWGRVLRGGSWSDHAGYCRSTIRFSNDPCCGYSDYGLRIVLLN